MCVARVSSVLCAFVCVVSVLCVWLCFVCCVREAVCVFGCWSYAHDVRCVDCVWLCLFCTSLAYSMWSVQWFSCAL